MLSLIKGAASIKPCGESDKILTRKSISSKQALTQALIAGDSFVGIFTLLRKEAKVKVIKYKVRSCDSSQPDLLDLSKSVQLASILLINGRFGELLCF